MAALCGCVAVLVGGCVSTALLCVTSLGLYRLQLRLHWKSPSPALALCENAPACRLMSALQLGLCDVYEKKRDDGDPLTCASSSNFCRMDALVWSSYVAKPSLLIPASAGIAAIEKIILLLSALSESFSHDWTRYNLLLATILRDALAGASASRLPHSVVPGGIM